MKIDLIAYLQSVIDKKFIARPQGYDPNQVDETLDQIIEHIVALVEEHQKETSLNEKLKLQIEALNRDLEKTRQDLLLTESHIKKMEASGMSVAILNDRLNQIEAKKSENQPPNKKNEK